MLFSSVSLESDQGIVLRRFSSQEHGVVFIVFSHKFGKILLTDKLMKKKEIYGGKTDLYSLIEFTFLKNEFQDYQQLLICDNLEKYAHIYNDAHLSICTAIIVEMVDLSHCFFQKNLLVFNTLKYFLEGNASMTQQECLFRWTHFVIYIFRLTGFSLSRLNPDIFRTGQQDHLKIIHFFYNQKNIPLSFQNVPKNVQEIAEVLVIIFEYFFEKKLKSKIFLQKYFLF